MGDHRRRQPLLFEWGDFDRPAQRAWLAKLLDHQPDAIQPFLNICVKDASEQSFRINRALIESLVDLDDLTNRARAAYLTPPMERGHLLEAFLAWREEAPPG